MVRRNLTFGSQVRWRPRTPDRNRRPGVIRVFQGVPFKRHHPRMVRLYVDDKGGSYRVHDAIFGVPPAKPFKHVRVPLGDRRATVRYFKPESGPLRAYRFVKGETRDITEAGLLKQLQAAGIVAVQDPAFNPQANSPRARPHP